MEYEFSEGFMGDLTKLLEFCHEHDTDNMELEFSIKGILLVVGVTFSVRPTEPSMTEEVDT